MPAKKKRVAAKKRGAKKQATRKRADGSKKRTGSRSGRTGSANYPRHGVRKVLRIPQAIFDQNAGNECTVAESADYVGVGNHGPYGVEVSSATKYGLIVRSSAGKVKPTDLAAQILKPQSSEDEIAGLRAAVQLAPQISDVYKHYRGENLPDQKFFDNTVADTYKVPREKLDEFRSVFIESLKDAKLLEDHNGKVRVLDVTDQHVDGGAKTQTQKTLERGITISPSDSCFVMQPFAGAVGAYYESIFKPAIQKAGLRPVRADDEIFATGKIIDQVWRGIGEAKVLVAELTGRNPNVFYELGLAHALQKPVVLVSSNEQDVPFDLQHIRVIFYNCEDPFWGEKLIDKIAENIVSALRNPEEAIFRSDVALPSPA